MCCKGWASSWSRFLLLFHLVRRIIHLTNFLLIGWFVCCCTLFFVSLLLCCILMVCLLHTLIFVLVCQCMHPSIHPTICFFTFSCSGAMSYFKSFNLCVLAGSEWPSNIRSPYYHTDASSLFTDYFIQMKLDDRIYIPFDCRFLCRKVRHIGLQLVSYTGFRSQCHICVRQTLVSYTSQEAVELIFPRKLLFFWSTFVCFMLSLQFAYVDNLKGHVTAAALQMLRFSILFLKKLFIRLDAMQQ